MDPQIFEIIKLVLQIILIVCSAVITPNVLKWIKQKTTKEQRDEALYWIEALTPIAEQIFNERGQGEVKEEWIIKWLADHNIKLNREQLQVLIAMVVTYYNSINWEGVIN